MTNGNSKGLNLGWNPWWGVIVGIVVATAIALLLGALASRSAGHLLPHDHAHVRRDRERLLRGEPEPLGLRRDQRHRGARLHRERQRAPEPPLLRRARRWRCSSTSGSDTSCERRSGWRSRAFETTRCAWARSGYNVAVHRTMAFGVAGFIAALGGVLFVWWNGHIDPASISIGAAIDLLVICVIGGLYAPRGRLARRARVRRHPELRAHRRPARRRRHVPHLIGVIFLLIVLVSPGGLMGIWESLLRRVRRDRRSRVWRRRRRAMRLHAAAGPTGSERGGMFRPSPWTPRCC